MLPFCTYCKIFASEAQRGRRRALISRNFRIVGCDFMLHLAANSWFKAHHLSRRFFCLDRSFLLNSVRKPGRRRGSVLARRLVLGEKVPADETFDLVVIGCGPAGEKAGAQAAYFSKRVAVIERAPVVGGSCINTGTVPSKTLRESALYFSGLGQRGLYGIDYSLKENLTVHDFMHHERKVVEMERRRILKNLELHKIDYIQGQASFEDSHTVIVGNRKLNGEVILISTGSKP